MMRRYIFFVACSLLICNALGKAEAQSFLPNPKSTLDIPADSLSPEQYARAKRLATLLMAPCCYSKTAAEDQSGEAYRVKMEVRRGILEGYTDAEILEGFQRMYGEKILAKPTTTGFNKMVWIMPIVGLLVGVLLYALFMRKTRVKQTGAAVSDKPASSAGATGPDAEDDPYVKRLERELKAFDD